MGASELVLLRPVALTARPGRPRAEEILLISSRRRATRRRSFLFLLLETLFGGGPRPPSTPRACAPLLVSRDWHCLFVSPGHKALRSGLFRGAILAASISV